MSDIKLSGEFQPNVYLDFGQGKIFSNRWAHGYVPFDIMGWKKTDNENPLYVYAENENGSLYNTGIECPSTLMCIDPNGERNIKIDIFKGVELIDSNYVVRLEKYNQRYEYLSYIAEDITDEEFDELLKLEGEICSFHFDEENLYDPIYINAGVDYYNKPPKPGEQLKYEEFKHSWGTSYEPVVIRPQAICMPMLRPIIVDGKEYGSVTTVNDGDTFTITVLPNKFQYFCESKKSNTVLLFSDKRYLMGESYHKSYNSKYIHPYFTPDENVNYDEDNIDNYYGKFKINGEYVGLILLQTGTTITLKAEHTKIEINGVDTDVVYWKIENPQAFQEFQKPYDISLRFQIEFSGEVFSGGGAVFENKKVYCSNIYNGDLDKDDWIDITINTKDNCLENSFYMQDSWWSW